MFRGSEGVNGTCLPSEVKNATCEDIFKAVLKSATIVVQMRRFKMRDNYEMIRTFYSSSKKKECELHCLQRKMVLEKSEHQIATSMSALVIT